MADIKTIESKVSSTPLGPAANEKDAEMIRFIEEMTTNADAVQEKVLAEILSRNAKTEYLEQCNLGGATDRDAFKKKVPMVTYEDILPYVQRIADGDGSAILSAQPISEILTTTGTSDGKKKMIPTVKEDLDRSLLFHTLTMAVMNLYIPGLGKGKGLYFMFVKPETKTPGGLMARSFLTSVYQSEQFKSLHLCNVYTSPLAPIFCTDSFQSMYAQMLCGVYQRLDVLRIGAVFASSLLRAIRFLQLNWEQLAADIASGTLNPSISDPSVREEVLDLLLPDQELAQFLTLECSKGDWSGIVKRLWPNTKYLDVIVTGTMAQYIPTLEYYSGGLPMASTVYASSECYFGINLRPMCAPSEVSYTIIPNLGYFEFLPVNAVTKCGTATSQLVDLAHVEVGKEYEVVVTTYAGLYRYRVGDILQVTGFHNSSPQFRFVRRKNVLSIDTEKTDQAELQKAVDTASELLKPYNATVVDYTSHAHTKSIPGHYVIYWELLEKEQGDGKGPVDGEVMGKCCLAIEESLNMRYRMYRSEYMTIGPLEIRVVRSGTFEELMDYAISRDASFNQYKVPRCVTSLPILELLDSRVVSTHFSPATPKWTPGQSD